MWDDAVTRPQRRSVRLADYDYSSAGAYFVTICTHAGLPVLGRLEDGKADLTDAGRIVEREWLRTPTIRHNVLLDVYVVMPNHFHGILLLLDLADTGRLPQPSVSGHSTDQRTISPGRTLGAIVRGFKGASTSKVRASSNGKITQLWQRSYHDHVIRNQADIDRIREYIANNPLQWELDRYYRKEEPG